MQYKTTSLFQNWVSLVNSNDEEVLRIKKEGSGIYSIYEKSDSDSFKFIRKFRTRKSLSTENLVNEALDVLEQAIN